MLNDLRMFTRYAFGLRDYLKHELGPEEAGLRIENQLAFRERSFLNILEKGVFSNPKSPYRRLLEHAGIEFADVCKMVRELGVEGTLERLYDAGVYVTLSEFKGRKPIERPGLTIDVCSHDFDNPFLVKHYEARSSGSRGVGTRVIIDLDLLTHEAAHFYFFVSAFDLDKSPIGAWRSPPPSTAGMKLILRYAKLGKSVEKWFAQSRLSLSPGSLKYLLFTYFTLYCGKIMGKPMPIPEYVPLENASRVAIWLATKKSEKTPAMLDTNASSGVRVCLSAREKGLDISGTFFRLGGEPYTQAKADVIAETGSRAVCHYSISEIGTVGIACASPNALDDVHILRDKVALIQRTKYIGNSELKVGVLVYTTVLPSCPKLMLNVESDDYGTLEDRVCECHIGKLGFTKHLSGIRSYEKLTSEGMHFIGDDLIRLVEEVLPGRFGGFPTDYQLVEEEVDGIPRVNILVSPRLEGISEERLIATVFEFLQSYPGGNIGVDRWREARTLRMIRREPYSTASAKVLPLHIIRNV